MRKPFSSPNPTLLPRSLAPNHYLLPVEHVVDSTVVRDNADEPYHNNLIQRRNRRPKRKYLPEYVPRSGQDDNTAGYDGSVVHGILRDWKDGRYREDDRHKERPEDTVQIDLGGEDHSVNGSVFRPR